MYQPAVPVLWTDVSNLGIRSDRQILHTNGTYIRRNDGLVIGREDYRPHPIIYTGHYREERLFGQITDKVLVERINHYWDKYYGVEFTNCSAFANYLTTGKFIACKSDDLLVIEQGMRPYEMASRVDVGDMVCIMYVKQRFGNSRRHRFSTYYRKVRKLHHDKQSFVCSSVLGITHRSFCSGEIKQLLNGGWLSDYHFMVCAGKQKGKPIWISQCGKHEPGTSEVAFAVTRGEHEPYLCDVPVITFIKKRRK